MNAVSAIALRQVAVTVSDGDTALGFYDAFNGVSQGAEVQVAGDLVHRLGL